MNPRTLLLLTTLASPASGFSPSSPFRPRSQLNYVDDYVSHEISIETRVQAAMASADLTQMKKLLTEMYHLQDACTEEGNQTDQECDIIVKEKREVLMKSLEEKIASVFMTTAMTVMAMSRSDAPPTLEDQVQTCISNTRSFSLEEMKSMLNRLEELQSGCTEEGNQTNQECDIVVKAQRDACIRKLESKIDSPLAQMRSELEQGKSHSLGELTDMLHFLEHQTDACTEEGNQVSDAPKMLITMHTLACSLLDNALPNI